MFDILYPFKIKNKKIEGILIGELQDVLSNKNNKKYTLINTSSTGCLLMNKKTSKPKMLGCVTNYYEGKKFKSLKNCRMIQDEFKIPKTRNCSTCHINAITNYVNNVIK